MNPLVSLLFCCQVAGLPDGTQLDYTGSLALHARETAKAGKTFHMTALVVGAAGDGQSLFYFVDERGGGAWAWPERFGQFSLAQPGDAAPQLLQIHDGMPNPVRIRRPVFEFTEKLAADTSWTDGQDEYLVGRSKKVQGRDCWPVEVAAANGRHQSLLVEAGTGMIVTAEQRVFMGRGEEYELKLELSEQKTLTGPQLAAARAASQQLLTLQSALSRKPDVRTADLLPKQLELARQNLPELQQSATETPWARLVEAITRDVQQQSRKLDGLAGLEKKFVGQTVTWKDLALLSGKAIKAEELQGQVVVLQFWEYNGEVLLEPYGQVGYLDFLYSRRQKQGVKVIGVAVDVKEAQAAAARRSARKFKDFMNLSFNIAVDDGTLLEQFGDPRALGAALPLWIVVDAAGRITHYKVGFYDIKPDEGLRELDEAVQAAARSKRQE